MQNLADPEELNNEDPTICERINLMHGLEYLNLTLRDFQYLSRFSLNLYKFEITLQCTIDIQNLE